MIGRQLTTTSPSSLSSSRSTPCVDGCCGPMLTVSSSRRSSVVAIYPPCHGEVHGLAAERLGSPQRMPLPGVWQHDPPQVWVALEADAKQVEHLALVPVGARHARRQARRLAIGGSLDPQPRLLGHRIEQVDELETLLAPQAIDRGQVDEARVAQLAAHPLDGLE